MAGLLKRILGRDRGEALRCSAVVAAAGSSTRRGEDKLLLPLDEQPVLVRWTAAPISPKLWWSPARI